MKIGSLIFSNRVVRAALVVLSVLVAIGWLVVSDATAVRLLGVVSALLLAIAIKASAESYVEMKKAKESSRLAVESAGQSKRTLEESRAELAMAKQRLARLEAAMFEERGAFAQDRQRTEAQIRELRSEMSNKTKELTTRIDQLANRSGTRRHEGTTESLRELGLRDSLAGLSPPVPEPEE